MVRKLDSCFETIKSVEGLLAFYDNFFVFIIPVEKGRPVERMLLLFADVPNYELSIATFRGAVSLTTFVTN
jgi:hypothetical protein